MYLFVEKGLRGEIYTFVRDLVKQTTRHEKYWSYKTVKIHNTSRWKQLIWICNEWYIPYGRFKWLKDVDSFNVNFNQRK